MHYRFCIVAHIALLIALLFLAACSITSSTPPPPTSTEPSTPTAHSMLQPSSIPVQPSATSTPFVAAASTPNSSTETPVSNGVVTWAQGINTKLMDGVYDFDGFWSPTRNEIVYHQVEDSQDTVLVRFAAPDFKPKEIRIPFSSPDKTFGACRFTNFIWSPDGQKIFFGGPVAHPSQYDMEKCSLWMVEHDGSSPRRYLPELSGRSLSFGWLNDRTMVTDAYRGGMQAFDLLTGKTLNRVNFQEKGSILYTQDYLVSTDYSENIHPTTVFAFGRRDKPIDLTISADELGLRYAHLPPINNYRADFTDVTTILNGVIPGTDKVLAYWFGEKMDLTDPNKPGIIDVNKLVVWDIDGNTIMTLIPFGIYGQISPDQHTLAYLTYGPPGLDAMNKPISVINRYADAGIYLQLYNLNTHTVFMSIPGIALPDENPLMGPASYDPGLNFSPDGHYLALLSDREIEFDQKGWPGKVQSKPVTGNQSFLYVLDLKNHKLAWSHSGLAPLPTEPEEDGTPLLQAHLPVWSPKSDKFVYYDADNNINLVDLFNNTDTPLTSAVHGQPQVNWSHDGTYIAIQILDENYNMKVAFLKVP
jgi:hypothetical protein